jgi:hypothetical protein
MARSPVASRMTVEGTGVGAGGKAVEVHTLEDPKSDRPTNHCPFVLDEKLTLLKSELCMLTVFWPGIFVMLPLTLRFGAPAGIVKADCIFVPL